MLLPRQARAAVRVAVPIELDQDIGLGDALKRLTTKLGIQPCTPCQERAATLNRHVVFTRRSSRG